MANEYYSNESVAGRFLAGETASGAEVDNKFDGVEAGFDLLPDPQLIHQGRVNFVSDTGAADAYVVALSVAPAEYTAGLQVRFVAGNANTGPATINVNSLGVQTIRRQDGSALRAGDIPAGGLVSVTHDGTRFLLDTSTGRMVLDAETARTGAETAQGLAETAQGLSESAQAASEAARDASQTAQGLSEAARDASQAGADKASQWADSAAEVEPGRRSAKHWAEAAEGVVNGSAGNLGHWSLTEPRAPAGQILVAQGVDQVATWQEPPAIPTIAYDARGTLRGLTASANDKVHVEGLGLFVFALGSDEPDDDESCFATATGRWLLEAAHWDVISMWQLPDDEARDVFDEDEPVRFADSFADSFADRVIHGTATCAITSVAANNFATFTGMVIGASVGDRVLVTPPGDVGENADDTGRLAFYGRVTAPNTVTITLHSPATASTTNIAVRTAWPVTVFKEV